MVGFNLIGSAWRGTFSKRGRFGLSAANSTDSAHAQFTPRFEGQVCPCGATHCAQPTRDPAQDRPVGPRALRQEERAKAEAGGRAALSNAAVPETASGEARP